MKRLHSLLKIAAISIFLISCASTKVSVPSNGTEKKSDESELNSQNTENQIEEKDNTPLINNTIPDSRQELLDNFEDGNFWSSELSYDFDNKINLSYGTQVSNYWASEQENSGKWSFKECSSNESKAFFCCNQLLYTDWTDAKALICDINNQCSSSVNINFATISGPGIWSQTSKNIKLGCGINTNVLFDLVNGTTDSEENNIPGISDIDSISYAVFVIYGNNKGGDIYIDNIRLLY